MPRPSKEEEVNFVTLMKDSGRRKAKDPNSDRKSVHYESIPEDIPVMGPIDEELEASPPQQDIPVLDLNDETRKRRKTKGREGAGRRKETHSRLDTLNSRKNTESGLRELEVEAENRRLKEELKRSQEAINLMLGVLKSNPKLEKFRMQAEKILHGETAALASEYGNAGKDSRKSEGSRFFPTLSFNSHGSIMKDYMLVAAKQARRTASSSRGVLRERER